MISMIVINEEVQEKKNRGSNLATVDRRKRTGRCNNRPILCAVWPKYSTGKECCTFFEHLKGQSVLDTTF